MSARISLLMVGAELLDGRTPDTNSHFLIRELTRAGYEVAAVSTCGDDERIIAASLRDLASVSAAVIVSGGLGPTSDDLTRESVATLCGAPLVRRDESLERLRELFARKRRPFDPSNEKQALFPAGASVLPNPLGTAEGFALAYRSSSGGERVLIAALPGVPGELRSMFAGSVLPLLEKLPRGAPIIRRTLRVFGLTEAAVGTRVSGAGIDGAVSVAYRAAFPEIEVQLTCRDRALSERSAALARTAIGAEYVFSESAEVPLELAVHMLLLERRETITTAESCTGGGLGALLTRHSGSSGFFAGGIVTYSNELKSELLGVRAETLADHGAVSHETAREMAAGARERLGSSLAVSVTGIAGPEGGSEEKPAGTFYIGFASAEGTESYRFFSEGSRDRVRTFAAWTALDVVRRRLSALPIHAHE